MQLLDLTSLLQLIQELIALFLEFLFNIRRGPLQVLDVCQLFFVVYWAHKRVALPHFEEARDHLSDVVLLERVGGDRLEHWLQALFHVVVGRLVLLRDIVVEIAKAPEEVRARELLLLSRIASTSLRNLCLVLGVREVAKVLDEVHNQVKVSEGLLVDRAHLVVHKRRA